MPFAVALWLTAAPVCKVETEPPNAKGYVFRVLVSLNQTLNTLTGGEPDETLSSRWGRGRKKHRFDRAACWLLDRLDPCHCTTAIERDENGKPLPHQMHGDK